MAEIEVCSSSSSGDRCTILSSDAFFGIVNHHDVQRSFINLRSIVNITGVDAFFRNTPRFIYQDIYGMYYETDAKIGYLFHHPSHAPFLAKLVIQRFNISNPSPSYIRPSETAYVS
jgi:hypothetical protein